MKVVGWRAYYEGRRVYDSHYTTWADLPADGFVEAYLYKEGGYREQMAGMDHYFYVADTDVYGYSNDAVDEIESRYPGADIKKGKWVSSEEMAEIQETAKDFLWWKPDPFNRDR